MQPKAASSWMRAAAPLRVPERCGDGGREPAVGSAAGPTLRVLVTVA
ncbi:hypothetical protein ABZ957_05830 [Streptomyces sp. NPDC046316]